MQATTIDAQSGSMILDTITIAPGGSFGWHTHGAPVAVVVPPARSPSSTRRSTAARRSRSRREQSFVEPANHVHLARNDGKKPVTVYAVYLGVPKQTRPDVGATQPAGCNA